MRVLIAGLAQEREFHAGYYYLLEELSKQEDVRFYSDFDARRKLLPLDSKVELFTRGNWFLGKCLHRASKKLGVKKRITGLKRAVRAFDPDVVLVRLNSFFSQLDFHDCSFISCPKVYLIADIHLWHKKQLDCIRRSDFDLVLFVYRFWMDKIKEKLDNRVGWLPHSVNPKVFKDNGTRSFDVISSGHRYPSDYPLRALIYRYLHHNGDKITFSMPCHPQMTMNKRISRNSCMIRGNYARFLASGKLFAFGSSNRNYPVAKYVEGMASGSLVLAPKPEDADELGFVDGKNFVEINKNNFVEKIRYYLKNEEERQNIVNNASKLVLEHHTTEKRTTQLINFLHEL